ncbi:hypothetical protein HNP86_001976 [Methanococcus maripaludis]|uniref:DUF4097 domain-containing protein n=1 Tax=Methanococcus maripaludis TaxID=39152 RepID=A0A7J9NWY6_METMI|nr:DUF4097 family beta strand repeat-containing protein [Methanococcus maripaludis]MBA2851817.1 hypothetical protein [Methanococcus maripaludis]
MEAFRVGTKCVFENCIDGEILTTPEKFGFLKSDINVKTLNLKPEDVVKSLWLRYNGLQSDIHILSDDIGNALECSHEHYIGAEPTILHLTRSSHSIVRMVEKPVRYHVVKMCGADKPEFIATGVSSHADKTPGDMDITNIGLVGCMRLNRNVHYGDIELVTKSGNCYLDLTGVDVAKLEVRTQTGDIHLKLSNSESLYYINLYTKSGNIYVEFENDSEQRVFMSLSAGSGNVTFVTGSECILSTSPTTDITKHSGFKRTRDLKFANGNLTKAERRYDVQIKVHAPIGALTCMSKI